MNIVDLYNGIYKQYRTINLILSLGLDKWWRKNLIKELKQIKPLPETICDICAGTGDLTEILAYEFSKSIIKAVDANPNMLELAIKKNKFNNVEFIKSNIKKLPFEDNLFDCVTISFATRNIYFSNEFDEIIKEINRVLKNGGIFIGVEIINHPSKIINFFSKIYIKFAISLINKINPTISTSYNFLKNSIFKFDLKKFKDILIKNIGNIKIKYVFPGNIIIHISQKTI